MNNSTQTNSYDHTSCAYAVSIFFTTAMAMISLAAFIGNIVVIAAVYKIPNLRTSTNYYYVNMAVSDFLACLTVWPLYLTDEIITSRGSLIHGSLAIAGCKVGTFVRNVSNSVSLLSLVLIAVDRFIATVFPLKFALLSTNIRATLLLATWLISIGYCYPSSHHSTIIKVGRETFCRLTMDASAIVMYNTFALSLIIALLIVITILYLRIMRVLRRRVKPGHHVHTEGSSDEHKRNKHNRNVMKIFKSIVVAYFVCWFLFCSFLILKIIVPELFIRDKCKLILGFSYYIFPMLNTVINPVILFSFSSNFRVALKELCPFSLSNCRPCYKTASVSPHQENEDLPELVALDIVERNGIHNKPEQIGGTLTATLG